MRHGSGRVGSSEVLSIQLEHYWIGSMTEFAKDYGMFFSKLTNQINFSKIYHFESITYKITFGSDKKKSHFGDFVLFKVI